MQAQGFGAGNRGVESDPSRPHRVEKGSPFEDGMGVTLLGELGMTLTTNRKRTTASNYMLAHDLALEPISIVGPKGRRRYGCRGGRSPSSAEFCCAGINLSSVMTAANASSETPASLARLISEINFSALVGRGGLVSATRS